MQLQENIKNKYYVYALVDPINRVPFYIGKGKTGRAWVHLRAACRQNKKKLAYIRLIRELGHEPEIGFIAEHLTERDALDVEYICIRHGYMTGLPLTNSMGIISLAEDGKRGGWKLKERSLSHRKALSNSLKSSVRAIQARKILHASLVGRSAWNKGTRGRQVAWNKGKPADKSVCPQCFREGSTSNMKRWHFDSCKYQVV